MTDKERLEEIKSRVWKDKGTYTMGDYSQREGYIYTLSDYDYEWLVKQAERVEELEKELTHQAEHFDICYYVIEKEKKVVEEQNKRYRKAINNIIEKAMLFGTNEEVYDAIQDAIQVLEGEE